MDKTSTKILTVCVCAGLALTVLIAFGSVYRNGFVSYDDDVYITDNPQVQSGITWDGIFWAFTTSYASNWHPLTWLSHMLDTQLYGLNAAGHHLTNLLFHMFNVILLFCILRKITGTVWQSAFVAAAFAIHPLRVESVVWVAERKDVLSGLFWMLTIYAYVQYTKHKSIRGFLLTLLLFALGLLAKPMLVTLPFVLLLLDYWPLERLQFSTQVNTNIGSKPNPNKKEESRREPFLSLLLEKAPFFLLAVISSVVTFLVQRSGGAMVIMKSISVPVRFMNAMVSYISYIGKTFWPSRLAVLYPHPGSNLVILKVILSVVLLVGITVLAIRQGRRRRWLAVGWLWYVGTLVPVIGFVQVGMQAMADRYTYLPSIGLYIIIAWLAADIARRWRYKEVVLGTVAVAVLTAMIICTWRQVGYWENSYKLFTHTVEVTKNNSVAQLGVGLALKSQGRFNEAISEFRKALEYDPEYMDARNNLAIVLKAQGKYDEAYKHYLYILQFKPVEARTYNNLGSLLLDQGKIDEAIVQYHNALDIEPDYAKVHYGLGKALQLKGRTNVAITHFRKAIQLKPYWSPVLNDLAWTLATHGDPNVRNPDEAVLLAQKACKLTKYEDWMLLDTLAAAYAAVGQFELAVKTEEKALSLAAMSNAKELVEGIENRVKLYRQAKPYREVLPDKN